MTIIINYRVIISHYFYFISKYVLWECGTNRVQVL